MFMIVRLALRPHANDLEYTWLVCNAHGFHVNAVKSLVEEQGLHVLVIQDILRGL